MAKQGELTPKQARFVEEYLKDLNATQAYIRAGYSESTANKSGPRLLVDVGVQQAIAAARKLQSERAAVDADWVIKRLKLEAEREGENTSHSARVAAAAHLGKHLGMFVDKHEITDKTPPARLLIVGPNRLEPSVNGTNGTH